MKKVTAILVFVSALLFLALPASAAPPTLVGAWLVSVTNDATGNEVSAAYTFNRGGTMSASIELANVSSGNGAWKRTGPRSYSTTFVSFVDDGDPATSVLSKNIVSIEVQPGGEAIDVELRFELSVDGTVVATGTSQGAGVRIVAEDF